ncbi:putative holin-like toxin [Leuconostoc lactis]
MFILSLITLVVVLSKNNTKK